MGFLSKLNRKRKKVQKKILEPVTKTFAKISDKFIPNELRPAMPYLAGIGSLMLPPGMGPYMRALASGAINVGGQIAADDVSDPNTTTTIANIRRDVEVKIAEMPPLGSNSNL